MLYLVLIHSFPFSFISVQSAIFLYFVTFTFSSFSSFFNTLLSFVFINHSITVRLLSTFSFHASAFSYSKSFLPFSLLSSSIPLSLTHSVFHPTQPYFFFSPSFTRAFHRWLQVLRRTISIPQQGNMQTARPNSRTPSESFPPPAVYDPKAMVVALPTGSSISFFPF